MRWRNLGAGLVLAWLATSCSSDDGVGAAAATPVTSEILARGTVAWGEQADQHLNWQMESIAGFSHAVSLRTTSATRVASASASRQGPDDQLWFVAATPGEGAPVLVFGGAGPEVDEVVLIDAAGVQVTIALTPVPDREWSMAVQELPAEWALQPPSALDVVALADGSEIAREALPGLS